MKNKLLLTTALAGAVFAVSANAKVVEGTKGYLIPQGETYVLEENSLVQKTIQVISAVHFLQVSQEKMVLESWL